MTKRRLSLPLWSDGLTVTLLVIIFAILMLFSVYLLQYIYLPSIYFHISYVLTIVLTAFMVICYPTKKLTFFLILFVIFSLLFLQNIRTAPDIMNSPDLNYQNQVALNTMESGRHLFGFRLSEEWSEAKGYSYYPIAELLVSQTSIVLNIPSSLIYKYAGPFLIVTAMVFLFYFYRSILRSRRLAITSVFVAGLCSWLVYFCSYAVHLTFAIFFLALLLLSLERRKGNVGWFGISILSIALIVTSHAFTDVIVMTIFIFTYLGYKFLSYHKKQLSIPFTKSTLMIIVVFSLSWLSFVARYILETITIRGIRVISQFFSPEIDTTKITPSSIGLKPMWMTGIEYVALVLFMSFVGLEIWKRLRNKRFSLGDNLLPYSLSAILISGSFMSVWIVGFKTESDLMWRGLIFLYIFCAPFFVFYISRLEKKTLRPVKIFNSIQKHHKHRSQLTTRAIPIIILSIVSLNAVYFSVPQMIYDANAPYIMEDIRLPLKQWTHGGEFAKSYMPDTIIFGVRLAFTYIGGYGEKNFSQLLVKNSLTEWVTSHPNSYVFLRESLTMIPDYNGFQPTPQEYVSTTENSNKLYDAGEVILIYTR